MKHLTGKCLCGKCNYTVHSKPISQGICYCKQCRRAGGAEGSPLMIVLSEAFECDRKNLSFYETKSNRNVMVKRYFCSICGSPVFAELSDIKEIITVKVATLDNPEVFNPDYLVFTKSAMPSTAFNPKIPAYDGAAPIEILMGEK